MTLPFLARRPAAPAASVLLAVTDRWRRPADYTPGGRFHRVVVIRDRAGVVRETLLPDEHPALVSFLARVAVAA